MDRTLGCTDTPSSVPRETATLEFFEDYVVQTQIAIGAEKCHKDFVKGRILCVNCIQSSRRDDFGERTCKLNNGKIDDRTAFFG